MKRIETAPTPATDSSDENLSLDARNCAVRRIRIGTLLGLFAPGIEYALWLNFAIPRLIEAAADPDIYATVVEHFTEIALTRGLDVVTPFIVGWWLAYPLFRVVCSLIRRCLVPAVPAHQWQIASDCALWPLPYAAAAGVLTWFVYTRVFPYGWVNDVTCGATGHLLGAWCYINLFLSWFKVARQTKARSAQERPRNQG